MKHLILDSKWLGSGRAVSAGEVRDDLTEDEGKILRNMGAATANKAEVERAEEKIAAEKTAKKSVEPAATRERASARPATEKAAAGL